MSQFNKVLTIILAGILAILVFATRASCQAVYNDGAPITLGTRFTMKQDARMTAIRFFRQYPGEVKASLWQGSEKIGSSTFSTDSGWSYAEIKADLKAGQSYTVSYSHEFNSYTSTTDKLPESDIATFTSSAFIYQRDIFPVTSNGSNYMVEPVFERTFTGLDTIYLPRDTCGSSLKQWVEQGGALAIMMPEVGGTAYFSDSTTVYKAIFGAAQPHQARKDDASLRLYRFTRTYVIGGKSTSVRFTLYRTGAWIREIKDAAGVWQNYSY